ncbi:MAG: T9SS type A sorting domain-containing protein [Bacteroidota bacterium]|nr:T9SS type A sorting domain-containing protein [Bacteroidota bacterium]
MNAYSLEYHVQLSSMEYSLINDSILVVNLRPDARKNRITSADYRYSFKRIVNASDQEYLDGESRSMVSLPDSSVDSCSLRFIYRTLASSVSSQSRDPINLTVSIILPSAGLRFSFPGLEVMQHLQIYNLLGRAIKQIEIPAGTTEYTTPQFELPGGYYFARLGNMTAKFIVK